MTELNKISMTLEQAQLVAKNLKDETRRLVKEDEFLAMDTWPVEKGEQAVLIALPDTEDVSKPLHEIKWRTGVPLQVEVDKQPFYYCPKCNQINPSNTLALTNICCCTGDRTNYTQAKQLIIVPLKIWKEKLLDITEAGAIAEGFENKVEFLKYIYGCYVNYKIHELKESDEGYKEAEQIRVQSRKALKKIMFHDEIVDGLWNPGVWGIKFKLEEL